MNALYSDGDMTGDLGQFGHLILLHGIYEDTFRSKGHFTRQLSPASSPVILTKGKNGVNPCITQQQRSPLECVEVMNRIASARFSRTSGIELPSMFHFAMARVVLLAPYDGIQSLAKSISLQQPRHPIAHSNASNSEQEVLNWAQQEEV